MGRGLCVGTRKGLFVLHDGEVEGPLLPGWSIYHALRDPRSGTLYTASNHFVYGATDITTEGAREQIDKLAKKYLGQDEYPWTSPDKRRLKVRIQPAHVYSSGFD